jgi:hypothetical protein
MCANYLAWMEKQDKPTFYWPVLTFFWIVMFLFYIWSENIVIFYSAIVGSVAFLSGVYTRNYYRKKKK